MLIRIILFCALWAFALPVAGTFTEKNTAARYIAVVVLAIGAGAVFAYTAAECNFWKNVARRWKEQSILAERMLLENLAGIIGCAFPEDCPIKNWTVKFESNHKERKIDLVIKIGDDNLMVKVDENKFLSESIGVALQEAYDEFISKKEGQQEA